MSWAAESTVPQDLAWQNSNFDFGGDDTPIADKFDIFPLDVVRVIVLDRRSCKSKRNDFHLLILVRNTVQNNPLIKKHKSFET